MTTDDALRLMYPFPPDAIVDLAKFETMGLLSREVWTAIMDEVTDDPAEVAEAVDRARTRLKLHEELWQSQLASGNTRAWIESPYKADYLRVLLRDYYWVRDTYPAEGRDVLHVWRKNATTNG